MASDRRSWGKSEWQAHARDMERRYLEALDGWGETTSELEKFAGSNSELRAAIDSLHAESAMTGKLLQLAVQLIEEKHRALTAPRRVGRPKKRDEQELIKLYSGLEAEYLQEHAPQNAPSVAKVLRWYFAKEFQRLGKRASRAEEASFQTKLKSLEKRISEARTHMRVNFPKKG